MCPPYTHLLILWPIYLNFVTIRDLFNIFSINYVKLISVLSLVPSPDTQFRCKKMAPWPDMFLMFLLYLWLVGVQTTSLSIVTHLRLFLCSMDPISLIISPMNISTVTTVFAVAFYVSESTTLAHVTHCVLCRYWHLCIIFTGYGFMPKLLICASNCNSKENTYE